MRYVALLAPVFLVIGCSEKADTPPTGPELHTVINKSSGCDVQHISQLANSFFRTPRQQPVKTMVDALAASSPYSLAAKNKGFDIMAQIEGAVNDMPATSGDPAVGSDLVNHLLLCMYDPQSETSSYPEHFPDNFTVALTPTGPAHGAFGERSATATGAVFSRPYSAPFTGIAPPKTGSTVSSWGSVVTNTPARVVFYGFPAGEQTYDWRSIPHNAVFSPHIIIGICIDGDATSTANSKLMLTEVGEAVLAFEDAYFITPTTCSQTLAVLGNNPFQLAGRLVRLGAGLLTPQPLMAAVLSPGGLGGRSSKCCSEIEEGLVESAQLTFTPDPPFTNVQANRNFLVEVRATSGGVGVNGDCISFSAITNNGQGTTLFGTHECGPGTGPSALTKTVRKNNVDVAGVARICVNDPKTGTIQVVATGDIEGRGDAAVTVASKKLNVKPTASTPACS